MLTLVSLPLLLDGLGTAAFGTWALLQTFSALTGWLSLADLGLGVATTRAVADRASLDDEAGVGRAVGSSLVTALAIGLVCAALLLVVGRAAMPAAFNVPAALRDDLRFALVPFALQVVCELLGSMAGFSLDGVQRIDRSRALESLRRTVVIGASVVVAQGGGGLRGVAVAAALASAAATALALGVLLRSVPLASLRASRAESAALLHYGRRVWLLNGTGVLHRTMDRTVVGAILGPAAVALVEIATQVQNGVAAVLSAASYAATTSAAWVQARADRDRLRELLLRGTKYTCLVTLPLCGLVAVLAAPLLEAWLGSRYLEAAGLVALAVAYLATQAPLATGSNLLLGVGRAGAILGPAAVAVAVNLGASIVLVHTNGIAGAFVATILSSLVLTPLLARAVADATGVAIGEVARTAVLPTIWPALAAVAVAGAVRLAGWGDLVTLVLGFGLGGLAWLVVGAALALTADERTELRQLVPVGR
ncbi:MAG: oligosaccharide flippase family protein [Acidimicrobiales bacterium]